MKTETQDFVNLQDYCGSDDAERTIAKLADRLDDDIDIVFNDMYKELGVVTTDDAIEDYLSDDDHIEKLIGWKCLHYSSPEEQDYEEELAWKEITEWDDR